MGHGHGAMGQRRIVFSAHIDIAHRRPTTSRHRSSMTAYYVLLVMCRCSSESRGTSLLNARSCNDASCVLCDLCGATVWTCGGGVAAAGVVSGFSAPSPPGSGPYLTLAQQLTLSSSSSPSCAHRMRASRRARRRTASGPTTAQTASRKCRTRGVPPG
eukprot:scaffold10787_cov123-Isochrysis_galbana.AAC.10